MEVLGVKIENGRIAWIQVPGLGWLNASQDKFDFEGEFRLVESPPERISGAPDGTLAE